MKTKPGITCFVTMLTSILIFLLCEAFHDSAFSATATGGLYVIHVSSLRNEENARDEISQFNKLGLTAFYRYESVEGKGNWFRVYIGPFKTRRVAVESGKALLKEGVISYYRVRALEQDVVPDARTTKFEASKETGQTGSEEKPPATEAAQKPLERPTDKSPEVVKTPLEEPTDNPSEEAQKSVEKPIETPVEKPDDTRVQNVSGPEKAVTSSGEERAASASKSAYLPNESRFSLSLGVGVSMSPQADEFKITEQTSSLTNIFSFSGNAAEASLEGSLRMYKGLNLYGRFEYGRGSDVNLAFVSLGPKCRFNISDTLFPYLKGGAVYGDFTFDGAPGEFERNFGWEAGLGADFLKSRFKIGFDFLYRDIAFDYKSPDVPGVSASGSSLDASGFTFSGTVSFYF